MPTNYTIATLDAGPSLSYTGRVIRFATYAEVVAIAQAEHKEHGRTVNVTVDGVYGYWYHRCENGIATDRNSGSGIPKTAKIK